MNEPIKETREQRHTGKRLAAINALLDGHLKTTPLPATPPILHIVAAFGLDVKAGECGTQAQHERAWKSLDARGRVEDFSRNYWDYTDRRPRGEKGGVQTCTREELLWQHVAPLLRERLKFRVNRDLLPAWKQQEMERIAHLTGFDYADQWKTLCVETMPVPKSWGPGIDAITLAPTTLGAGWRRAKAITAKARAAAAKPPKPKSRWEC
jgi:hypothetical protein